MVGALADVADTLPEAAPGLVEVGSVDAVGRRQVVVLPAKEIRLVAFLDVMAVGAHDVDVRGLAVGGGDGAINLAQELAVT